MNNAATATVIATWNEKMTGAQKVTMRDGKCTCGCNGRDPWHAKTMTRVVRDVSWNIDGMRECRRLCSEGKTAAAMSVPVVTATISHPSGETVSVGLTAYVNKDGIVMPWTWRKL